MFYAGIGSRETPPSMLDEMLPLAEALADEGHWLRSGHARGADQAFERGAKSHATVFLPWKGYEYESRLYTRDVLDSPTAAAVALARDYHPAPDRLTQGALKLHGRNSHIVLGHDLKAPVGFVVCWARTDQRGRPQGGTGQACRIAEANGIPVFNLYQRDEAVKLWAWLARQ